MKKILFYAMRGEKMCFQHILLNALDLAAAGNEVKIVFEGESVKLPPVFEAEQHKLYLQAKEKGLIAGVCRACSAMLGVIEENQKYLPLLDDMMQHAGMKPFIEEGYEVISM
ncbi:MAG: hypothetical protein Q4G61_10195 [Tissierellia bacterium]|nr:hypothetical protein [Tissierellia bacterium]